MFLKIDGHFVFRLKRNVILFFLSFFFLTQVSSGTIVADFGTQVFVFGFFELLESTSSRNAFFTASRRIAFDCCF